MDPRPQPASRDVPAGSNARIPTDDAATCNGPRMTAKPHAADHPHKNWAA
jgi:hypothetical protein